MTDARRVLVRAALAMAVGIGFGRFTLGLLLPAMREGLGLTYGVAGLLASANLGAYLLGVATVPWMATRLGYAAVVRVSLVVAAVGFVVLALPVPTVLVAAALALTGVAGAMAWISSAALGAALADEERRGRVLGIIGVAIGAGMVVAAVTSILLSGHGEASWRAVWAVQAVLAVLAAVFVPAVPRRPAPPRPPGHRSARGLLGLQVSYGCFGVGYALFATFLVAAVGGGDDDGGVRGGALWIVVGVGALFGASAFGAWSDRLGRLRVLVVAQLVAAFACLAVVASRAGVPGGAVVGGFLLGFVMTSMASLVPAALADRLPIDDVPRAFAALTVVFACAQAVTPAVGGVLAEHGGGFSVVFLVAAGAFLAAGVGFGVSLSRPPTALPVPDPQPGRPPGG